MTLQEVVQSATVAQPTHNHLTVALWVAVAVVVAESIVVAIMVKARGGWGYVATIPVTNLRSITAIGLMVVTIVGTGIVGYLSGVWPPEYVYDTTAYTLTIWAGIEVAGVWLKRKTTDATIPSTQNLMAAQAASGLEVNALTARAVAAPGARQPIPGETVEHPMPVTTAPVSPLPKSGERGD